MFGGSMSMTNKYPNPSNASAPWLSNGNCPAATPALDKSHRASMDMASLAAGNVSWVVEDMPLRRVHGQAVMLPNGQVRGKLGGLWGEGTY